MSARCKVDCFVKQNIDGDDNEDEEDEDGEDEDEDEEDDGDDLTRIEMKQTELIYY